MSRKRVVDPVLAPLADARRKAGLSQSALARLVGTSQSAISELENGCQPPTLATLLKVASALGLRVSVEPGYGIDPMPYVSGDLGDR